MGPCFSYRTRMLFLHRLNIGWLRVRPDNIIKKIYPSTFSHKQVLGWLVPTHRRLGMCAGRPLVPHERAYLNNEAKLNLIIVGISSSTPELQVKIWIGFWTSAKLFSYAESICHIAAPVPVGGLVTRNLQSSDEKKRPRKCRRSLLLRTHFVRVYEDILVYEDNPHSRTSAPLTLVNNRQNLELNNEPRSRLKLTMLLLT